MVTTTVLDIANLPAPDVVEEIDFEAILAATAADLVERFPAIAGVIGLESEPARKLLEVDAFRETLIRARINDAMRSQLIAFATGADLDHLAAFYDVIRLEGEADERLRARIIFAIAGRSTGGTASRYRFMAMSASVAVRDAVVYRDGLSPVVHVAIFADTQDGVPTPAILDAVRESVGRRDVRMVNDTINVRSAVTQTVSIEADVWLLPATETMVFAGLEAQLRAAFASEAGLGFDLTRAWLTARLMVPGIQRVEILTPAVDVPAADYEALALGTITLNNRGRAI